MHLLDQRALGILILLLLGALVAVKRLATGSVLDRPGGGPLIRLVNVYNLFFLLVVNPVTAVLLIARRADVLGPTRVATGNSGGAVALEAAGLLLFVAGFVLMAWALGSLRTNYQLGGAPPRAGDEMVVRGPYRLVRHPMYAAALAISLGLACLLVSWAFALVFVVYLVLVLLLVPREEAALRRAYGERYLAYQETARRLLPFVY